MGLLDTLSFITAHPLNRDNKMAALARFAGWQLRSRLNRGLLPVRFVNNTRLLVARGMHGATGNIYCGLLEFEDMAFVLHLLRRGDGFVDVGANVGAYTVLAAGVAGAQCVSIEPIPATFSHLIDNVGANGISERVSALNIGVGEANDVIRFTAGLDAINHVATSEDVNSTETIEIPVKRLDDMLEGFSPVLIKIDVEGFETNVIAGADKTLRAPSLLGVIMELNGSGGRYGFDETKLHAAMLDYGFKSFTYSPFERRLLPLDGRNAGSGNTLYLRNVGEIAARLSSAPRFRTNNGWEI
jgi:FkbM family methyltransferase